MCDGVSSAVAIHEVNVVITGAPIRSQKTSIPAKQPVLVVPRSSLSDAGLAMWSWF